MVMRSIRGLRGAERAKRKLQALARRVSVVSSATQHLWNLVGFTGLGEEKETFTEIESLQQVGFRSRPKAGGDAEAVVLELGRGHQVVIASQDRDAEDVELAADETALHNSQVVILLKADGTVEIRTTGASLGATDGVVHGSGIDSLTGVSYTALGSVSSKVRVEK